MATDPSPSAPPGRTSIVLQDKLPASALSGEGLSDCELL